MSRFTCTLRTGALIGSLASLGCYATARVEPEPVYVEAAYVPRDVEVYPPHYYRGRTVYYVDGHWYQRRGTRWVYYRQEPPELYRRRVYVERAPRAPHPRVRRGWHRR